MGSLPRRFGLLALLTLALGGSGCYGPSILECSITCGAGSSCPSDTTCGSDGFCHLTVGHLCTGGTIDGSLPSIDGQPAVDARPGTIDAKISTVDAPIVGLPDAPSTIPDALQTLPDARPPGDAGECTLVGNGEPDNQCPGAVVGPIAEGKTLTIKDRAIFPASDTDVYDVPLAVGTTLGCTPGTTLTYALLIKLAGPATTDLRLRRYADDRVCRVASDSAGTAFCIPFAALCPGPTPEPPTFHFAVRANGGNPVVVCQPYSLEMVFCAAGSTCDHCKTF